MPEFARRGERAQDDAVDAPRRAPRVPAPGKQTLVGRLYEGALQPKLAGGPTDESAPATVAARGVFSTTGLGAPLPAALRDRLGRALGADFAAVRVREDAAVATLGAEAVTRGDDIAFAPGRYRPGDRAGDQLIAHELAHVVQQRAGRVPTATEDALHVDHGLEAEADALAARVTAEPDAPAAAIAPAATTVTTTAAAPQPKLVQTRVVNEEIHYKDDRDLGYPKLDFVKVSETVYRETTSGSEYGYLAETDQFWIEQFYFDPEQQRFFQLHESGFYFITDDPVWYEYKNGRYQPYQAPVEPQGVEEKRPKRKLEDDEQDDVGERVQLPDLGKAPPENTQLEFETNKRSVLLQLLTGHILVDADSVAAQIRLWNQHHDDKIGWQHFDEQDQRHLVEACRRLDGEVPKRVRAVKQEPKVGDAAELTIANHTYNCRVLSVDGGYHLVYEIVDVDPQIRQGTPNNQWVVRVPREDNPMTRQAKVANGMLEYRKLHQNLRPQIGNSDTAGTDGLYVVERIATACDASQWNPLGQKPTYDQLGPNLQNQLLQIRNVLEQNFNGHEVVPDFRPDNIRFRGPGGQLVVIDFSEAADQFTEEEYPGRLDWLVRELAGETPSNARNQNDHIYNWLLARAPGWLKQAMLKSRDRPQLWDL